MNEAQRSEESGDEGANLTGLLCDDAFLREDLKSQLGITGERKGVEYCTIYDDEWPDIIKMILIRANKINAGKLSLADLIIKCNHDSLKENMMDDEREAFKFSIEEFRDGSLSLSCGDNGMESDLVFASGAMTGDPVFEEQNAILNLIVSSLAKLNKCEELLKHATDIVDRLPEDEDTKWVLNATDAYFVAKR